MKYKVIVAYPQATVRKVHHIEVKDKAELDMLLEDTDFNPGDRAKKTETDINYGGEAYIDDVIKE